MSENNLTYFFTIYKIAIKHHKDIKNKKTTGKSNSL